MLDLDGHALAVARARAVDLAERRDGERLLLDVVEQLRDAGVEVLLDDAPHPAEGIVDAPPGSAPRPAGAPAAGGGSSWTIERNCLSFGPGALQAAELSPELLGQRDGARVHARMLRSAPSVPLRSRSPQRAAGRAPARSSS